jgi:hypothetical protein
MAYPTVEITKPEITYPLPTDHQALMDIFYNHWNKHSLQVRENNKKINPNADEIFVSREEGMMRSPTQDEIASVMPPKVVAAVILGNMHYQVGNGGWLQYDDNGYSAAIGGVQKLFEGAVKVGIENADKILQIIIEFRQRKENIENDVSNRWSSRFYEEEDDDEENFENYEDLCNRYYEIEGDVVCQAILDRFDEVVGYSFMEDLTLCQKGRF